MKSKEITKLIQDINKTKDKLTNKVKKKGIYEDFGQNEIKKLRDKHINISSYTDEMNYKRKLIREFDEWCMRYNG